MNVNERITVLPNNLINDCFALEEILRMEMIRRLARDGMDSSNGMIQNERN